MSIPIRPMNPTEVFKTPLDSVYPGLRIVDKFHPPNETFPNPSFSEIAGIRGLRDIYTPLIDRRPI